MSTAHKALLACVVTALAAVPVTLAAGASAPAPVVSTAPATSVTAGSATLAGSVNPEASATQYAFQWGPTTGYGHETPLTAAGSGTVAANVTTALSGLQPGSTYHFRIIAISAAGTSVGADDAFTTTGTAPPPSAPPRASTAAASNLGPAGATLNGTVNPQSQATTYYFEYGPTANYGYETAPANAGSGSADVAAAATLSGQPASTTFHFRLVAVSVGGTALGADRTFTTTTPPAVVTGGASQIRDTSVVLSGTINPEGHGTTYAYQYGTTPAYGLQTPPQSAGSGTTNVAARGYLTGLIQSTSYHYRLLATSNAGTTYGADRTVKTAGPATIPSSLRILGRMGFVSRSGWVGAVIACFGGNTTCAGQVTLVHGVTVIGQRSFRITAANGGFQNVRLTRLGRRMVSAAYPRLLTVDLVVTGAGGQRLSQVLRLARWR